MADDEVTRVAYAVVVFLFAAVGGGAPLRMQSRLQSKAMNQIATLGSIFGGGVFIAAGFVHLLGDAAKRLVIGHLDPDQVQ